MRELRLCEGTRFRRARSKIKGPEIDGVATDAVELKYADPSSQSGATRAVMYFSTVTHFPLRQLQYQGDKVVGDESFADLKINAGLSDSDFPF